MPCFYQKGKNIEQCEQDLLECAYSNRLTCSCMKDRGYQYLDVNSLPQSKKRRKIVVLFEESVGSAGYKYMAEEYWVADGRDLSSDKFRLVTDPNAPKRKLIGYRVRQDKYGKFTKIPVYKDQ